MLPSHRRRSKTLAARTNPTQCNRRYRPFIQVSDKLYVRILSATDLGISDRSMDVVSSDPSNLCSRPWSLDRLTTEDEENVNVCENVWPRPRRKNARPPSSQSPPHTATAQTPPAFRAGQPSSAARIPVSRFAGDADTCRSIRVAAVQDEPNPPGPIPGRAGEIRPAGRPDSRCRGRASGSLPRSLVDPPSSTRGALAGFTPPIPARPPPARTQLPSRPP
jgi:hypothetical protein